MSEYEMQDLGYDNTDLGQMSGQFNLPAPRPIEILVLLQPGWKLNRAILKMT